MTKDWQALAGPPAGSYREHSQDWYDSRATRASPGQLWFSKHSVTSRSKPALVCTNSDPSQLFIKFFSAWCFRYTGFGFDIYLTQSLGKSVFCQTTVDGVVLMDSKSEKLNWTFNKANQLKLFSCLHTFHLKLPGIDWTLCVRPTCG